MMYEQAASMIRERLDGHDPAPYFRDDRLVRAAVLLPVARLHDGRTGIVLTLRSDTVRDHRGQVAFPGGVCEQGDVDLLETALRETEEETGLPGSQVEVAGRLSKMFTLTGYSIQPFVGLVEQPEWRISQAEIARLIIAPLAGLLEPGRVTYDTVCFGEIEFVTPRFEIDGETVWGATARILVNFLRICFDFDPARDRSAPASTGGE